MKVIVYTSYGRHREDIARVYKYSSENIKRVEQLMDWI